MNNCACYCEWRKRRKGKLEQPHSESHFIWLTVSFPICKWASFVLFHHHLTHTFMEFFFFFFNTIALIFLVIALHLGFTKKSLREEKGAKYISQKYSSTVVFLNCMWICGSYFNYWFSGGEEDGCEKGKNKTFSSTGWVVFSFRLPISILFQPNLHSLSLHVPPSECTLFLRRRIFWCF